MLLDRRVNQLPGRVSVLGAVGRVAFVIKKTPEGCRHFLKVDGRWKSVTGMDFHALLPNGKADVRVFEHDPATGRWDERRDSLELWNPETN